MTSSKEVFLEAREQELMTELCPVSLTKQSISIHASRIADMVFNGEASPLDITTKLAYIEQVIGEARKMIQDECVQDALKFKGDATINGAKVEVAEVGVKYDYSGCGDSVWERFDSDERSAKEAKKDREKFLKTIKGQMTVTDEGTGEIITVKQPEKTASTNIKITFPK